ncbi:hypothetical protein F0L74_20610 [Chitinophaga agrisoli]|uniref:Uncharacterized protein n=1 Tax=Chitinophaga agrisoli TaxID=2607653 RepID=A0A5B2VK58_9BACT|nr:hypothetical protein [Chitinophaga agrisoli]KAA2238629.1 hypothetical protein F0L74_20610 [Chitinophaga agrisoli]
MKKLEAKKLQLNPIKIAKLYHVRSGGNTPFASDASTCQVSCGTCSVITCTDVVCPTVRGCDPWTEA